ncbi:hypothetical protein [Paenibacillus donghaensis]|uniref:Lipoprotein n=1 Tax=Paenibacillus donghaensis TaxID=414771 RepID=A0A2Z2KLS0_9BACL|nr:hypothetical protein [Paenibacillus donghaensis]ASA19568.1 hypothetical protein B9T62_01265 [Paenibacillus donghaensis]
MNKSIVKAALAVTMLVSGVMGQGVVTTAAAAKPAATVKPNATVKPATTAVPIMRDNLSKYGLKKDVELPVTVEAGGLSYTLEKVMIYDFKSPEVKKLQKLYGFQNMGGILVNPKYFVWTKVTITNISKNKLIGSGRTIENMVLLRFQDGQILDGIWPANRAEKTNDKEALWTYNLAPGQKLTSNLAYAYNGEFNYFVMRTFNNGKISEKYVVKE